MQNNKVNKSFAFEINFESDRRYSPVWADEGKLSSFFLLCSIFCFTKIAFDFLSSFVSLLRKLTECLKMGPITYGTFPP